MAAAGQAIERVGSAGHLSRTGARALTSGLEELGREAIGATGPMGRLAEGMLLLGGPIALGVGAAIGAVVLALNAHKKAAEEAAKANDKFLDGLKQISAHAALLVEQLKLIDLQEKLASALPAGQLSFGQRLLVGLGVPGGGVAGPEEVEVIRRKITEQQNRINQAAIKAGAEVGKKGKEIADAFLENFLNTVDTSHMGLAEIWNRLSAMAGPKGIEAGSKFADAWLKIVEQRAGNLFSTGQLDPLGLTGARGQSRLGALTAPGAFLGAAERSFRAGIGPAQATADQAEYNRVLQESGQILQRVLTPQQLYSQQVAVLQRAEQLGIITAAQRIQGEKDLAAAMQKTAEKALLLKISIINAVAGAIAAVAGGGSAGGFLSAIGGVVGFINPIAGAVIGGLGSVVSAEEAGANRRHQEAQANADRRNQDLLNAMRQGVVYVQLPSGGLVSPHDPNFQDWLLRALASASGKGVIVLPAAA